MMAARRNLPGLAGIAPIAPGYWRLGGLACSGGGFGCARKSCSTSMPPVCTMAREMRINSDSSSMTIIQATKYDSRTMSPEPGASLPVAGAEPSSSGMLSPSLPVVRQHLPCPRHPRCPRLWRQLALRSASGQARWQFQCVPRSTLWNWDHRTGSSPSPIRTRQRRSRWLAE